MMLDDVYTLIACLHKVVQIVAQVSGVVRKLLRRVLSAKSGAAKLSATGSLSARATVSQGLPAYLAALNGSSEVVWFEGIGDPK